MTADQPQILDAAPTRLVGRDLEVSALANDLAQVIEGQPRVLLLSGEPGIGKSRIAAEVVGSLAARFAVTVARCRAGDTAPPLGLRQLATSLGLEPAPQAADVDDLEPDRERAAGDALAEALIAVSEDQPQLLLVEDAQWADSQTLRFLDLLTYGLADDWSGHRGRIGVLATVREPTEATGHRPVLNRIARATVSRAVSLEGIDEAATGELLHEVLGALPTYQLTTRIHHASRGNPLFIQFAARQALTLGHIERVGQRLRYSGPAEELPVPDELIESVDALRRSLTEASSNLLATAACFGARFDLDQLVALTRVSREVATAAIDEGTSHGLLVADRDGYRFEHDLIRFAFYSTLGAQTRRDLHWRIAESLNGDGANADPSEVVVHLLEAGPVAPAALVLEQCERAAEAAAERGAWVDAARLYGEAAEAATTAEAGPATVARLRCRAGEAFEHEHDAASAINEFKAATTLLEGLDLDAEQTQELGRAIYHLVRAQANHDARLGAEVDTSALDRFIALHGEEYPVIAGFLLADKSEAAMRSGRIEDVERFAAEALAVAEREQAHRLTARVQQTIGMQRWMSLDASAAADAYQHAIEEAEQAASPNRVLRARTRRAMIHFFAGEVSEARMLAERSHGEALELSELSDRAMASAELSAMAGLRGRFEEAERYAADCVVFLDRTGYSDARDLLLPSLAYTRLLRGHEDEAGDALDRWEQPPGATWGLLQLARWWAGDTDGVARTVEDEPRRAYWQAPIPAPPFLTTSIALGELASCLGSAQMAEHQVSLLADGAGRGVVIGNPAVLIERVRGQLAATLGESDEAETRLNTAVQLATELEAPAEEALAHLALAAEFERRDVRAHRSVIEDHLERSVRLSSAHGLEPVLARAVRAAQRLGAVPAAEPAAAEYPDGLTERQVEVLRLLTQGLTNVQMAERLVLAPSTVQRHIANIYVKINVSNQAQAAAYAVRHGLDQ